MTPGEVLGHYAEVGWLGLPSGHPLRRLAEEHVEQALRGAAVRPASPTPPRGPAGP